MAVPGATKAAKRGSVTSIQSQRRGSVMRISAFVSEIADDVRSRLKTRSAANSRQNANELCNSPVLIRPRDGRRRSLLSIESLLTTSSQGKLRLRRGSLQASAASGSEFGMAFGHLWSVQPQLNVPTKTGKTETFRNLRVIRLGEDLASKDLKEGGNGKKGNEGKSMKKKKKKKMSANKVDAVDDASEARVSLDAKSMDTSNVLNSSGDQGYLPPIKAGLQHKSPCRSHDTSPTSCHNTNQIKKTSDGHLLSPLKFFHETIIGPNHAERNKDEDMIAKDVNEKETNHKTAENRK